ncbi:MAG: ABC transporter ATP-binding protein [Actinomycetota bacterium]|nr:ABC transporter ATP-binding protein [Actinomycetota bacterium]
MTRRHLLTLIATAGIVAGAVATPARAATPAVETVPLQFHLAVPPEGLLGTTTCTVVADLYKPSDAGPANRVPAILTTNGFGGSKADQAGLGRAFAARGYAVLSYSGLGFGGSGCKITLDDRAHDAAAASQLLRFLGGDPSVVGTRTDTAQPYHVDFVRLDTGTGLAHDPRVGMVGGSYGGQIQFATAAVDRRLDTIVPMITWNDLAYSLAPNNTSLPPDRVPNATPGVAKFEWSSLFAGEGILDGLEFATVDPTRNVGCPNLDDPACPDLALLNIQGYPSAATIDYARAHSVASYLGQITVPTLLAQGEADTLFNLQESDATYRALRARGVPVKMIWQSWGHSHGTPAPGELDFSDPTANYEGRVIAAWFDHYLKGTGPAPALDFSYFRDWVGYAGDAAPAYATAPSYPVGSRQRLYLSGSCDLLTGTAALTASRTAVRSGTCSYANLAGPAPLSYTETSALDQTLPVTDAPGSFAKYTSAPLAGDLDVVGSPTLDVRVDAPTVAVRQQLDPALTLVFYAKLYDVAPDGTITLVHRLISPVRVTDVTQPVHVELPAIVHRFATGHRLAVVIAATDAAYRNAPVVAPVTIRTDSAAPGLLTLPVTAGSLLRASP